MGYKRIITLIMFCSQRTPAFIVLMVVCLNYLEVFIAYYQGMSRNRLHAVNPHAFFAIGRDRVGKGSRLGEITIGQDLSTPSPQWT